MVQTVRLLLPAYAAGDHRDLYGFARKGGDPTFDACARLRLRRRYRDQRRKAWMYGTPKPV